MPIKPLLISFTLLMLPLCSRSSSATRHVISTLITTSKNIPTFIVIRGQTEPIETAKKTKFSVLFMLFQLVHRDDGLDAPVVVHHNGKVRLEAGFRQHQIGMVDALGHAVQRLSYLAVQKE